MAQLYHMNLHMSCMYVSMLTSQFIVVPLFFFFNPDPDHLHIQGTL